MRIMCVWGELFCLEKKNHLKYGGNGNSECPGDLGEDNFEWTQGENTLKTEDGNERKGSQSNGRLKTEEVVTSTEQGWVNDLMEKNTFPS